MSNKTIYIAFACLASVFFNIQTYGQAFGANATAVSVSDCNQNSFYNTSSNGAYEIAASENSFTNKNFGVHTQNSGTLLLSGAEVWTFKTPGAANVCGVRMYYRTYLATAIPGDFSSIKIPFLDDCDVPNGTYTSGGICIEGDQKWKTGGGAPPFSPIDLTAKVKGDYVLEVYFELSGSSTSPNSCPEKMLVNNSGNNYKALYSIQSPVLNSNNPTSCNGTEGSITISGLLAGATYSISYMDDETFMEPADFTANASGQVIVSGLDAGIYSGFSLLVNGCTTELNTGVILTDPVITPSFTKIAAFCAGSTAPLLPAISNNFVSGTWSPAIIDNQVSGSYKFTPDADQCGIPVTVNVTVNPIVEPTFSFGTSLTICAGETVPTLPNTSSNGKIGTWSPSIIDNTNSGTYTFTPAAGQCAISTTFTVTVTPNIIPTFSFGTSLTVCAGDDMIPNLPKTSANGIKGTWDPAEVSNQVSGVYTFTPTAGVCATTAILTVTINTNEIPTFDFGTSLTLCSGTSAPVLPATSGNSITGTWIPAVVSSTTSDTYTFLPDYGQCAENATFTVTVEDNISPTFEFGNSLTICENESVPVLPTTSEDGITGTWSPATIDNTQSGTYTFTPAAGQCATTATFSVTVNPDVTPIFSFGTTLTICEDESVPVLPATSENGITGSWSPATIDNTQSGTYTFTPAAGQCASTVAFPVTVNPNITPTFSFGTTLTICEDETVPVLPTTSENGITGTWSPAIIGNTQSGTYTFTPAAGECATTATFTVTVNPKTTPTFSFGTTLSVCAGDDMIPNLPKTSANGIKGTWNPSEVSNQVSGVYTFTPTAGLCATTAILTVTINTNVIPTFDFGTALTLCSGASAPVLPATSENNITGTWIPAVVSNTTSDTYTFLPDYGQCAENATFTVTVEDNITSTFAFGNSLTICENGSVPALPLTSENGINGTWDAASVSTTTSATYTFTPAAGQCASTATFTVTVNPVTTPTFDFGTTLVICAEGFVPALPNTSGNGITGTWNPAVVDKQSSGVYTFTPTAGLCATATTLNVTVNQNVLPAFEFGTSFTICSDSTVPVLPAVSTNGITGTWNPSTIDNQADGTYTFKPDEGSCGTMTTLTVTVTQSIAPTFDLEPALTICTGGDVPVLPTTSINGIDGIWAPATIDKTVSGVYIFTPTATPEQCIGKFTLTVTVNPILEPSFTFGKTLSLCLGSTAPLLPAISDNGVTGTWLPAVISNQASATYTFTSAPGQCATEGTTLAVTVNDIPTVNAGVNNTVNDGNNVAGNNFTGTPAGVVYNWTNSNTGIGLPANGTGNIPSFTATNLGSAPISGTITVTPVNNGCPGAAQSYVITVNPLDKDVFVPNVFTPNNDGKNDVLFVYSNYIDELEMRIFNQYGQEIHLINSINRGWDGTHKGKQQPVGVYVYTLRAVLTDGRTVKLKGSITLLR